MMIKDAINHFVAGKSLTRREAYLVMDEILSGKATEAQISAFLVALQLKGGTVDEIAGSVDAYRERVTPLSIDDENAIDTSGTGGDDLGTFNISTVAAFIAAGAGAKVVKHGYRSISSQCGSADVLQKLGIQTELFPDQFYRVFRTTGLAFIFAPRYKPTFRHFAGIRRSLGVRTLINILDPLTKPALTKRHLIGVYDYQLSRLIAEVLREFGMFQAMVVSGENGLDELNICGKTHVVELSGNDIIEYDLMPEDVGLKTWPVEALQGGDADTNQQILISILDGEAGAPRDVSIYNAAAALRMAGVAADIKEGVALAAESIDSGAAKHKLQDMITISRTL
ncbi:MAG: anthranilate phosphoribosyltransferase [Calditrichaeota bacterium]|nr:anthranilate phosphoribosyltransferase [Calditrichota bacterium]MCB0302870.1 anthranilate phosphoribosyltransferase [Calditrichota bacterium]MCB0312669.1 anthranilate phosphoribosyltransferase [Calditrichota bacterium]MCB9088004.1 anthranilate phosphoribosyltransferase [Calditrichia bacterium]